MNTIWAIVREGKIVPLQEIEVPEGTRALVTLLPEEDGSEFWLAAGESSLREVWGNEEEDVYAKLLEK